MAGEAEDEIPETGAVFTFGKSKFADNIPSKFWLKNDIPLKIACGDEHTALITKNGRLFMFGSNNWGQLGLGSKRTVNKPTCVKALKTEKVLLVACGRNHTLICTAQGKVFSSGGNSEGQLGLGDCEERTTFQRIHAFDSLGPIKMLAAGSNTSAALTESGKLFMWGDNTEGQIGLAKESHAPSPQEVGVGGPISWVSCGYYHSAFVTAEGALYTFGECDSGKLGLTTEQLPRHRVPQMVKSIKEPVTQVACGGGHTVALTEERLFTFGLGQFGQLGHGTFIFESRLPRPVEHFKKGRVCQVACGENHTAVVTDGGLLYTFGDGRHGKLGLGEENFTNQFKPTVCSRFLKYGVQAATCGGCHMVVLARPRDGGSGDVTLEEEDVIEYILEKPYGEVLGCTLDSSTLNRSLSARVRRRERERSPDQFGAMFCTLPTMTPGYLHPPLSVPGHATLPRASELTHRKLPNGLEHHGSTGSNLQEQAGDDTGSVVESLTDADSVKGLGETTDFLNMTHVMQLDPVEKTLTLTPVQKRKGKNGKTNRGQKENQKTERLPKQSSFSSTSPSHKSGSAGRELLRHHSSRSLGSQRQKTSGQNKENLILAVEQLQRIHRKNKTHIENDEKADSQQQLRPAEGKQQLTKVGRRPEAAASESESAAAKVKQVQQKRAKSKAIVVRSAGLSSPAKPTDSPGFHLSDALNEESTKSKEREEQPEAPRNIHTFKKSKNEKNKKVLQDRKQPEEKQETSNVSLLAGAASVAAASVLVHEASRRLFKSSSPSEDSQSVLRAQSEDSEAHGASFSNKSAVSINIQPPASPSETEGSQDKSESVTANEEEEKESIQGTEEEEEEEEEEEGQEEEQRTSADVSDEEEENVTQSSDKASDDEKDGDSDTLHPEDESQSDVEDEEGGESRSEGEEEEEEKEEEEEEEEEGSSTAESESEDEKEGERKERDVEEEEGESEVGESEEGSDHEIERKKASESEEEGEEEEADSLSEEEEGDSKSDAEDSDAESETEGEEAEEEQSSTEREEESNEEEEEEEEEESESNEEEEEEGSEEEDQGEEEGDEGEEEESEQNEEEEAEEEEEDEETDVQEEEEEGEETEKEEEDEEEETDRVEEEEDAEENEEEEEESDSEEDEESESEEEEEDEKSDSEEEEGEESGSEEEEDEETDSEEDEEEESDSEEEEEIKKKKHPVKRGQQHRSGVKGQAAESEEFWGDVLPQYLNLK